MARLPCEPTLRAVHHVDVPSIAGGTFEPGRSIFSDPPHGTTLLPRLAVRTHRRAGSLLIALTAGCTGRGAGPIATAVRDSMGVRIVRLGSPESSPPPWRSTVLFTTAAVDSIVLSGDSRRFPARARFAADSSLLIADDSRVAMVTPDGKFSRQFTRAGDGPGEFRSVETLGVAEDGSIVSGDFGGGRMAELTLQGAVTRTISHLEAYGSMEPEPVTMLADGRVLVVPWQWRPSRGPFAALHRSPFDRDPVPLLIYASSGRIVDSLGLWPGLERGTLANGVTRFPVPFARSVVYAGRGAFTVIGVTDSLDLSLFQGTALKLRLIQAAAPRRATALDRANWDSVVLRTWGDDGTTIVKAEAGVAGPRSLPAIGGVAIDDEHNIWVGDYITPRTSVRRWRIFSPAGELIGAIDLPAFNEAFMPSRTELLDVALGRIALLRESVDGDVFIEVRSLQRGT